ncbi:Protein of unknown function [Pyronema omphalodes CBS 100304]|uniref:Uncharacterized protein n=1 Tax=Pyronema omphalodes (strain CBS 100304) TaxID=1076935 RepID=U4LRN0_PYROM|nr:Protein of unknown function [Pyronema omphalodes CBS 100304]
MPPGTPSLQPPQLQDVLRPRLLDSERIATASSSFSPFFVGSFTFLLISLLLLLFDLRTNLQNPRQVVLRFLFRGRMSTTVMDPSSVQPAFSPRSGTVVWLSGCSPPDTVIGLRQFLFLPCGSMWLGFRWCFGV